MECDGKESRWKSNKKTFCHRVIVLRGTIGNTIIRVSVYGWLIYQLTR